MSEVQSAVFIFVVSPQLRADDPVLGVRVEKSQDKFIFSHLEHLMRAQYSRELADAGIGPEKLKWYTLPTPIDIEPIEDLLQRLEELKEQRQKRRASLVVRSEWFGDGDHVCIVFETEKPIRVPPEDNHDEINHRQAIEHGAQAPSPSTAATSATAYSQGQQKHPIYNGRPPQYVGPPLSIYNSTFATIQERLMKLDDGAAVDPKLAKDVAQLFDVCNTQHASEREMSKKVLPVLERLFGVGFADHVRTRNGTTESDAVATANTLDGHRAIISHAELKQYLGIGGASELQNALTVRKHQVSDEYKTIRNVSNCPCLHISIAGPYIQFAGSVLVDIFISQPFTPFLYLGPDPNRTERVYQLARIISIFKDGVTTLQKHYQEMTTSTTTELARLFPDPTYRTQGLVVPRLVFKERYRFHGWTADVFSRALFRAELGNESVLVKFSERYCIEAHSLLAGKQLAPAIRYFGWLKGGMAMIVMEELKGTTAQQQWSSPENIADTVLADVKKAMTILHDNGFVYGDIRSPNVFVRQEKQDNSQLVWRARLLDFDWSGKEGTVFYPTNLNMEIKWADGVESCAPILKEHDDIMLERLNERPQPLRISQTFNVKGTGTPLASVKE
ncbi:hypothetical protein EWM64_g10117 [Hericium alpestre]|uniref:Protein kinase domain-containing protein n=1 Tax=Hericium alpestre TaxID=135208 RepID=A0A4Y9ZGM6_9AGAM|nr:hypothetical protein EWM64_g10117 [Hericium alpestre]